MNHEHQFAEILAQLTDSAAVELTLEQIHQLREIFRARPEWLRVYAEQLQSHAMLRTMNGMPPDTLAMPNEPALPAASPSTPATPIAFRWLTGLGGASMSGMMFSGLLFALLSIGAVGAWWLNNPTFSHPSATAGLGPSATAAQSSTVAVLTDSRNCRWQKSALSPQISDPLHVGDSLQLESGVVELKYPLGVRLVAQGPVMLTLESGKTVRLSSGKLTAEILTDAGRGFSVITPTATYVDQGTEFGVEVNQGGDSRVHVFKGEVDMSLRPEPGRQPALPAQKLTSNVSAQLEGDTKAVTFNHDEGESFIRSMSDIERDNHVVAYWRFEDHPFGALLPTTHEETSLIRATTDSSFNGNDLFTWSDGTRPAFSEHVAVDVVPLTGRANLSCLDTTQATTAPSRDVYSHSNFSHASPIDIQAISPLEWTIELSIKALEINGLQTIICRDASVQDGDAEPRLQFLLTGEGHPRIQFVDVYQKLYSLTAQDFEVVPRQWYHLAVVSDGRMLKMYVDQLDGQGYLVVGKQELREDGRAALDHVPGAKWALGRGRQAGRPGHPFRGWMDEVRISSAALSPAMFLFSPPQSAQPDLGKSLTKE